MEVRNKLQKVQQRRTEGHRSPALRLQDPRGAPECGEPRSRAVPVLSPQASSLPLNKRGKEGGSLLLPCLCCHTSKNSDTPSE